MNSQKATYFLALALTAFAFHSEYQRGAFPVLHRAANSAGISFCRVATKAERTVAMARLAIAAPAMKNNDVVVSVDGGELADLSQLSEDQRAMLRDRIRAQTETLQAQVRQRRGEFREIRSFARQQVRLADSMSRVVVMRSGGCAKIRVRVPERAPLATIDDDTDTF
jgi:hypothetical protein